MYSVEEDVRDILESARSTRRAGVRSDLYTTLVRAKQMLNGEAPELTSLTERAKKYIDPDLVPGAGIIEEEDGRGLRCPIRGCGRWFDQLATHITVSHKQDLPRIGNRGPVESFCRLLRLDPNASLVSHEHRALLSESHKRGHERREERLIIDEALQSLGERLTEHERQLCEMDKSHRWRTNSPGDPDGPGSGHERWVSVRMGVLRGHGDPEELLQEGRRRHQRKKQEKQKTKKERVADGNDEELKKAVKKRKRTLSEKASRDRVLSVGFRNLLNLCDAQIAQRVLQIRDRVGRWPGLKDVMVHDQQLLGVMALMEWEWEHVLAFARLTIGGDDDEDRRAVMSLLRAWVNANGRVPREDDIGPSGELPLLPSKKTILRALGVQGWKEVRGKIRHKIEYGNWSLDEAA